MSIIDDTIREAEQIAISMGCVKPNGEADLDLAIQRLEQET